MSSLDTNNMKAEIWQKQNETFAAYAAKLHVPLSATFELTARCNLKCKMCYVSMDQAQIDKQGSELTKDQWLDIARKTIDAGTLYLLLTGGEPLIRHDFAEIYTELCQMGFIITLNTNATLMSDEYFDLFSKYPPTAVAVTLYGSNPETYEKVCGSAEGFEQTIRGLEMFSKISTNIEVRTTFIKDNMHELDEVRAIANRYTKRFAINYLVFGSTRVETCDAAQYRMTPEESLAIDLANQIYYTTLDQSDKEPVDPEVQAYFESLSPDRDFGFKMHPEVITCLATKSMYWISWDGKMLPCGTFDSPYTLPLQEGFTEAWNRLPGLFMDIRHPKECYDCELADGQCPNCPGYMQADTGDFEVLSEWFCDLAKKRAILYSTPIEHYIEHNRNKPV
jgi:MoaA/NifB/PqqE/SkfB family radical SAM enzyme